MNNNPIDLQSGASQFKFTCVKHGYNPEEVDVVIDMLIRQNEDLKRENNQLTQAFNECNVKVRQLAQSTQVIMQERQKEKQRRADIMATAGRIAGEAAADAWRKAAEIIANENPVTEQFSQQANTAPVTSKADSPDQTAEFDTYDDFFKSLSCPMNNRKNSEIFPEKSSDIPASKLCMLNFPSHERLCGEGF